MHLDKQNILLQQLFKNFDVSKDVVGRKTSLHFFPHVPTKNQITTASFSQKSAWRTGFIKGNPTRISMSAKTEPWLFDF